MITVQPQDAIYVPIVLCDHCGVRITDARDGNYQWFVPTDPASTPPRSIVQLHKACVRPYEAAHPGDGLWAWESLQLLPLYLAGNLNINDSDARELHEIHYHSFQETSHGAEG